MVCRCVQCNKCGGSGDIWLSISGDYRGEHRIDDLDSPETCPWCDGDGIIEMCDECREEIEQEDW